MTKERNVGRAEFQAAYRGARKAVRDGADSEGISKLRGCWGVYALILAGHVLISRKLASCHLFARL